MKELLMFLLWAITAVGMGSCGNSYTAPEPDSWGSRHADIYYQIQGDSKWQTVEL